MPVSGYRDSSRAVTHSNFTAWLCYKLISGLTLQVSSREQGVNDVNTNNLLQRSLLHKKTIRLNERLDTDRNISFHLFRTKTEQQYFCFVNKDDLYPFTDFLTWVSFAPQKLASYMKASDDICHIVISAPEFFFVRVYTGVLTNTEILVLT